MKDNGAAPPFLGGRRAKRTEFSASRAKAKKGLRWMPMAISADEGRGTLRKASGSRAQALIRGCPNGETRGGAPPASVVESIDGRGAPGELKHLSTQRNRNNSPSSGERTGRSPNRSQTGVVGPDNREPEIRALAEWCGTASQSG